MKSIRSAAGISTLGVGIACLLSGCGGSTNSSSFANLKSYDAVPNGGTATVSASGASTASLTAFTTSAYVNASAGLESASFTLTGPPAITSPTYPVSLNSGVFYTAIVLGRADVSSSDSRYPKLVIAGDDQTTPQSADCRIRVVQAAPDAGTVDVLVNGIDTSANTAYSTVTSYSELAAGSETVEVRTSGTSTFIVPSTVFTTLAGHRYTLYVTEPTTSPTYSFQVVQDS